MKLRKTLAGVLGAGTLLFGMGAANATLIDFTDSSVWNDTPQPPAHSYFADIGKVTLTSEPGDEVNFTDFDGDTSVLKDDLYAKTNSSSAFDGVGVVDDEVTHGTQELTVTFEKELLIGRLDFLDLFFESGSGDQETMLVEFVDSNGISTGSKSFEAEEAFKDKGGYLSATFDAISAKELVFTVDAPNDGVGSADAAVAAIGVVPIPAAVWLFGSALLGMVGIGARRSRKA